MLRLRTVTLWLSILVLLSVAAAAAIEAQQPVMKADTVDPRLFHCRDDELSRPASTGGCQRLGAYPLSRIPDAPLFWHIRTVPAGTHPAQDERQTDFMVEAAGQEWLFSFGPKDVVPTTGKPVISIGPLPLRPAKTYQVVAYFVVMPAREYTIIHTHPGPEAWYVLEGAQCLDTPQGAMKLAAGQGGVVPPDTPMRLHSSGSTTRRALFIVIHDPALPWASGTDWTPTGACGN